MVSFKKYFFVPLTGLAVVFASSCKNTSKDLRLPPEGTEFKQPVILPLKFSKTKKIDWADIKAITIQPVIQKLDFNKLPSQRYDSSDFKPYKYPVEEAEFDYNALPQKDFDVDKLPSKPLKFKKFILPPPKLIKAGLPRLKILNEMSLFEFGEAQGMLGNTVSCTFTDRDGFAWIATNNGIYRYDGENLLLYLSNPDGHFYYSILQDNIGQIWVGEFDGGINILDIHNGILKKTGTSGGLSSNKTLWMMEDMQQRIWVTFYPGSVNIIDPKTQTVRWFGKKQGLSDTTGTGGLAKDKNNNISISTAAGGLQVIDLQNHKIRYLDKAHGLKSDSLSAILFDHKGRLWISLYGKTINVLDFQKNTIQTIKEMQHPKQEISDLIEDDQGRIWISTFEQGIEIIDPQRRTTKNLNSGNGLNNNALFTIQQDKQGLIWMPTVTGLNTMVFNTVITNHFTKSNVTGLAEDNQGLIWLASFNEGMYILNRKTGISRHLDTRQGISSDTLQTVKVIDGEIFILSLFGLDIIDSAKKTMTRLTSKQGLNNKKRNLNGVIKDKESRLWIGSNDGLDIYDPRNGSLKHLDKTRYLSDNIIKDMTIDSQGMIWLSTRYGGINVIDPNTWTIRYLNNVQGIKHAVNKVLTADNKGNMWIGTDNGIYIANLKKNTLTSFSSQQGLIDDKVNSFIQHNERIYVGTEKGITIITPPATGTGTNRKWEAESFGKAYGVIKKNSTYYETDMITRDGLYWWGDAGITLLDLSKKDTITTPVHITGMNIMDQPKHFINPSNLKTKNGTLANTGYTLQNGLNWDSVTGADNMPVNLRLSYDHNFIQFHYSCLNLLPRDTAWYRYILIGADEEWSGITSASSTGNYINLQPGKYTFEVIGKNRNGLWSKPAQLSFTINPPWWQTWWAYIMYVCLLGGSIWAFSHYRSLQLIKDNRLLEHKVNIRTEEVLQQKEEIAAQRDSIERALDDLKHTQTQLIQSEKMASLGELTAGIAHEIQNPLNFINNFADVNTELINELQDMLKDGNTGEALAISDDIKQNEEKINHHGKRADSIVKGMLQHSRASSTTKEPTDVNKLVDEYLRLSYHGLRAKDKSFNAGMITRFDDTLPELNLVQRDIGRVMLNLFNNAFYAVQQKQKTVGKDYKPTVEVSTSVQKGYVEIKVSDNGTGIPDAIKDKIMQPFFTTKPTGEGTGLGLSLTYDMVVKGNGGNIKVESKEGEYTEFTIALPLC